MLKDKKAKKCKQVKEMLQGDKSCKKVPKNIEGEHCTLWDFVHSGTLCTLDFCEQCTPCEHCAFCEHFSFCEHCALWFFVHFCAFFLFLYFAKL